MLVAASTTHHNHLGSTACTTQTTMPNGDVCGARQSRLSSTAPPISHPSRRPAACIQPPTDRPHAPLHDGVRPSAQGHGPGAHRSTPSHGAHKIDLSATASCTRLAQTVEALHMDTGERAGGVALAARCRRRDASWLQIARHAESHPDARASSGTPNSDVGFRAKTPIFIGFWRICASNRAARRRDLRDRRANDGADSQRPLRTPTSTRHWRPRPPDARARPWTRAGAHRRHRPTARRRDTAAAARTRRCTAYILGTARRPPNTGNSAFEKSRKSRPLMGDFRENARIALETPRIDGACVAHPASVVACESVQGNGGRSAVSAGAATEDGWTAPGGDVYRARRGLGKHHWDD